MPIGKRKRANNENKDPDEKMMPNNELKLMVEKIQENQKSILEKLEKLDKTENEPSSNSITRKMEDLSKIIDENRENQKSIVEKLENQQRVLEKLEKLDSSETEKKPSFNSVISSRTLMKNAASTGTPSTGRSFVLKHVFENVSKFEDGKRYFSEIENHFGDSWCLGASKKGQQFAACLLSNKSWKNGTQAITTMFAIRVFGANGQIFRRESGPVVFGRYFGERFEGKEKTIIDWDELKKNYLVDDQLTMEVHVEIIEMSGIYKENLRCFDETRKNYSDVVLMVGNTKFYVSKLFLASHSPYFDSLFLGNFQESNQSEIKLTGICSEDFQNYLEVLYGDPAIDDTTVEGILLVADMYDTSIVIGKCEHFLAKNSIRSIRKKLQLAIRYNLDRLKENCLSEIKTKDDLKAVSPEDPKDVDHSILAELYKKSLSLQ